MDFQFYLSRFSHRFPYFIIIVLVCSVVGVNIAVLLPPEYVSQARLLMESEQIPGELASSTVQIPPREQLQIIQQRILTRATLLEMANRLDVYANYVSRTELNPDEIVTDMRRRIVIDLPNVGYLASGSTAALVTVSFSAPNAELSATVANEIVTKILSENVELRTGTSSQTLAFFEQEVARLDKQLSDIGDKISTFRAENQEALPDDQDFRRSELSSNQDRVIQLDREISRLKERRDRFLSIGAAGFAQGGSSQTAEQRLLQQRKDEMDGLMLVLAPGNPRIKALEAQIAQLEKQIDISSSTSEAEFLFKNELSDLDDTLKLLTEDRDRLNDEIKSLKERIDETPKNGIKLDSLQRDYANIQARYNEAVGNRARAQTGDLIETLSKGGRISVIEQAVVPLEPESPNRPLIASLGVLGGVALGIGFIVFLEFMTGAARRSGDIYRHLGITPFATLPLIRTQRDMRRRRLVYSGALFLTLVAVPFSLWIVHVYYIPLDAVIKTLAERLKIV